MGPCGGAFLKQDASKHWCKDGNPDYHFFLENCEEFGKRHHFAKHFPFLIDHLQWERLAALG